MVYDRTEIAISDVKNKLKKLKIGLCPTNNVNQVYDKAQTNRLKQLYITNK